MSVFIGSQMCGVNHTATPNVNIRQVSRYHRAGGPGAWICTRLTQLGWVSSTPRRAGRRQETATGYYVRSTRIRKVRSADVYGTGATFQDWVCAAPATRTKVTR